VEGDTPVDADAARDISDLKGLAGLSDEQLAAQAAREGSDGAAFTLLMERYREKVWRVCWRLMGSEHDAEDAAQEVFVRLFFERGKFAGRSTYSTWLHGVAIRTCGGGGGRTPAARSGSSRMPTRSRRAPPRSMPPTTSACCSMASTRRTGRWC
jgi:hypothetical protein